MKAVNDSLSGSDDDFGDTDECVVLQKQEKQAPTNILQSRAITPNTAHLKPSSQGMSMSKSSSNLNKGKMMASMHNSSTKQQSKVFTQQRQSCKQHNHVSIRIEDVY